MGLLFGWVSLFSPQKAGASAWFLQGGDWNTAENWYDNLVPSGERTYIGRGLTALADGGRTNYAENLYLGLTGGFLWDEHGDKIYLAGSGSVFVRGTLNTAHPYIGEIVFDAETGLPLAFARGSLAVMGGSLSYGYLDQAYGDYSVDGTVNSGETRIGTADGFNPSATISSTPDSTTVFNGSKIIVGCAKNTSILSVSGSNTTVNSGINVGDAPASIGTATISDGARLNSYTTVGVSGNGTLNIQSGATVVGEGSIGYSAGSNGTVNVTGGSWSATEGGGLSLSIGSRGEGVLNIDGGNVAQDFVLGSDGGSGTINLDDGTMNGSVGICRGTLNVNGGTLTAGGIRVGVNESDHGVMNVSAGDVTSDSIDVGNMTASASELNISGGTVTTNGAVTAGGDYGGTGVINVSGGSWDIAGKVTLGWEGDSRGTLNISGGTVSAGNIVLGYKGATGILNLDAGTLSVSGSILIANRYDSHGILNYNGGTLNASSIVIGAGSATVNFNQPGATTVDFGLTGNLELNVNANGTTTLTTENTYSGKTSIKAGTLILAQGATINNSAEINLGTADEQGILDVSAKSDFSIGSGQRLSGYGTVNLGEGKTLTIYGILSPGNSPGITSVIGDSELDAISTTLMELAGIGGVSGVDFDQYEVSGLLNYGGNLSIQGFSGYDITQTAAYQLFDFAQENGDFNSVTVGTTGLVLDNGIWAGSDALANYTFSQTSGIFSVASVPEPRAVALIGLSVIVLVLRRRQNRPLFKRKLAVRGLSIDRLVATEH